MNNYKNFGGLVMILLVAFTQAEPCQEFADFYAFENEGELGGDCSNKTLTDCFESCEDQTCMAFDWNADESKCCIWINAPHGIYKASQVCTYYRDVPCEVAPGYTMIEDYGERGGTCKKLPDLTACRQSCEDDQTCVAFDWGMDKLSCCLWQSRPGGGAFKGNLCLHYRDLATCLNVWMSGVQSNGIYTSNNLYCDFESDPDFIWTLIESFAYGNAAAHNGPFDALGWDSNPRSPNWKSFRAVLKYLKALEKRSTHLRITCGFDELTSFPEPLIFKDYSRIDLKDWRLLGPITWAEPEGCQLTEFTSVRGFNCSSCLVHFWKEPHLHLSEQNYNCNQTGLPPASPWWDTTLYSEDNFGYYHNVNPEHRCTASETSTTNYWFGVPKGARTSVSVRGSTLVKGMWTVSVKPVYGDQHGHNQVNDFDFADLFEQETLAVHVIEDLHLDMISDIDFLSVCQSTFTIPNPDILIDTAKWQIACRVPFDVTVTFTDFATDEEFSASLEGAHINGIRFLHGPVIETTIEGDEIRRCNFSDNRMEIEVGKPKPRDDNLDGIGCDSIRTDTGIGSKDRPRASSCITFLQTGEESVSVKLDAAMYDFEEVSSCFDDQNSVDYLESSKIVSQILVLKSHDDTDLVQSYQFTVPYEATDVTCNAEKDLEEESYKCMFYNETQKSWSADGCQGEIDVDQAEMTCVCNHLTAFAIIQEISTLRDKCRTSVLVGNPLWMVSVVFYVGLLIISIRQLFLLCLIGFEVDLKSVVHILLIFISILDIAIGISMFSSDTATGLTIPSVALAMIWTALYVLMFWIYAIVMLSWAQVYHLSKALREESQGNMFKIVYTSACVVISIILIITFAVAISASEKTADSAVIAGTALIGCICVFFAISFSIYGSLLIKEVTALKKRLGSTNEKTYPALLRRLTRFTVFVSIGFLIESFIVFISAFDGDTFFEYFEVFQSIYICVDIITLSTVLYLFYAVVRKHTQSQVSTIKLEERHGSTPVHI